MDSELAQIERHERSIGSGSHSDGATGIEDEQPGAVGADVTEYVDVAHRVILACALPGGDERTRTADPLLAKQVLYQLSYVPAPRV